MKLIVAGSRNSKATLDFLSKAINGFYFADKITEIVSGGARGIDLLGEEYAVTYNIPIKRFDAKWDDLDVPNARVKVRNGKEYNANAGFDRNEEMAKYADALIAIWDGKSPGTKHMIDCAKQYGLKIFLILETK